MRTILKGRGLLVGMAFLTAVSAVACAAKPAPGNARTGGGQSISPAATTASGPTVSQAASPTVAAPSPTPTGVQNLVITSAERRELAVPVARYFGTSLSGLVGGGPLPGTVYYAYDPATGTYWALADFELTGGMTIPIPMMFQKAGTGLWQFRRADFSQNGTQQVAPTCSEIQWFPPAVLTGWSMPTAPPAGVTC